MLNPSHCPHVVYASLASPAHPRKPNVRPSTQTHPMATHNCHAGSPVHHDQPVPSPARQRHHTWMHGMRHPHPNIACREARFPYLWRLNAAMYAIL